ncbi:hydantoinase B/oxoprolinase family protein [Flammeovirgaceae bacterium SG7u.111]|nr:hydantoinase B/oxoprolinase family protein [Flammeovirgaceae bacterium SG7u.132]WPO35064.1 hydantoinase B/oxoprolinase family protein [Flammeovirgaceae bacterium SG7u.111]
MQDWKIWVDTGGTFTDCIAISPQGKEHRAKVLSSSSLRGKIKEVHSSSLFTISCNWDTQANIFEGFSFRILQKKQAPILIKKLNLHRSELLLSTPFPSKIRAGEEFEITSNEEAPILAARLVTNTPLNQNFPAMNMRLGSTKGTNALLEKKGADVALVVTKGFADILRIGTQQRPDIFALNIQKPEPLYQQVFEIGGRLDAKGNVIEEVGKEELEKLTAEIKSSGVASVAIALLHSYRNSEQENRVESMLKDAFYTANSSALAPEIKIVPRAETAVVDAYLGPIIIKYLDSIKKSLPKNALKIMTSAGGLVSSEFFKPKDSLLSGPAGGVVGAAEIANRTGEEKILTLDMGGTSTDVARYDGEYDYQFECKIDDATVFSPALAIHTVAAGGGSICGFDGLKYTVGPESAGASPGPACYGAGGPLSITDVNLLLGRLDPTGFRIPLEKGAAQEAFEKVKGTSETAQEEVLSGFLDIANEKMAEAIRKISVSKGYDPTQFSLLAFGGAGGQHACKVAELLGISRVVVPYDAGLLSAYGMGQALIERFAERQFLQPFAQHQPNLQEIITDLSASATESLLQEGFKKGDTEVRKVLLFLRFAGQDQSIEVEFSSEKAPEKIFEEKYKKLFGHWIANREIELDTVRVIASNKPVEKPAIQKTDEKYSPAPARFVQSYVEKKWVETPVFVWEELEKGAGILGPALLLSSTSTTFVDKNWKFELDANSTGTINRIAEAKKEGKQDSQPEAIKLELFTNRFSGIANEMGALLQRTAFSVNVKERLDFSCALLDAYGRLVVNAPHIPVHLGSLGICTRLLAKELAMEKGDVVITNHPGFGGSHLPDITLVAPIFDDKNTLVGYVANRAHHSEVGGKRPGSMPPDAKNLAEEGVVISPQYLVRKGEPQWQEIRRLLTENKFPTRAIEENLADLNATLASLEAGKQALISLCRSHSSEEVGYFMKKLNDYTANLMLEKINEWKGKVFTAEEKLDDGTPLKVKFEVENQTLKIDFEGTGGVHPANLNANEAIVNSAVIYVLRLMLGKNVPLNEGIMQHVQMNLPEGILNPTFPPEPENCPAVVGGNTETSQRLVDTLLKAFGEVACSQGTMNNLLFGNENFGYYETIGGGSGAGNGFHGTDAVHQHMTNTRITDPEILEYRYPVRLERFAIRKGSGGAGTWKGGDGIIRELKFLAPVDLTVLTQHRQEAPYGSQSGENGLQGKQIVITAEGEEIPLKGIDGYPMKIGDKIVMETPGGGGFGEG